MRRSLLLTSLLLSAHVLADATKVDFVKQIVPILETECVACHKPSNKSENGELDITTKATALEGGDHGPIFVAGDPEKSRMYKDLLRPETDKKRMPPPPNHEALKKNEIDLIKQWIADGAEWDDAVVLKQRPKQEVRPPSLDNLELTTRIHDLIVKSTTEKTEADMKPYQGAIPRFKQEFPMVVIKGGSFLMGSPESEAGRGADEGPQVQVQIEPFWMGAYEVSWDLYMQFMITADSRYKDGSKKVRKPEDTDVDAISSPTTPYVDMTFGLGQKGYPAISMTEHAANKFCEFISAQTGQYYRLPTEAEWEYAARAGTTTAYFFGDDGSKLDEYAWYADNSDAEGTGQGSTQPIGKKKPNPWGLYDIYGNVNEWTLDQYDEKFYGTLASGVINPFNKPKTLFPRVARGGGFKSIAENCRSAKRRGSSEAWKQQDPQLPKSIWFHTDAQFLGFRIIRPLKVPSVEEMHFSWNSGTLNEKK